jgi:hypothetical protein
MVDVRVNYTWLMTVWNMTRDTYFLFYVHGLSYKLVTA